LCVLLNQLAAEKRVADVEAHMQNMQVFETFFFYVLMHYLETPLTCEPVECLRVKSISMRCVATTA